MIFCLVDTKYTMIDLQHLITKKSPELILTGRYINMGGSGIVLTVGGQQDVKNMQQKFIR